MEITEHAIHLLAEVESAVHAYYTDFTDLAQGFEHVQRVYHLALILSEKEQADGFIVGMAALLHDLGRTTRGPTRLHAERSAELAKQLLAAHDLPPQTLHGILHAILAHDYHRGTRPETLEARVLYDADRLDSQEKTSNMGRFLKCLISLRSNIRHDQENVTLEQVYHSNRREIDSAASFSSEERKV